MEEGCIQCVSSLLEPDILLLEPSLGLWLELGSNSSFLEPGPNRSSRAWGSGSARLDLSSLPKFQCVLDDSAHQGENVNKSMA